MSRRRVMPSHQPPARTFFPRRNATGRKLTTARPSRGAPDVESKESLKQFRLILTHHGESDKPFYNLTLSVPPLAVQQSPTNLFVPINEEQAAPIAEWLAASDFFKHARVTETQNDPTSQIPQYMLRVRIGDKHYEETLGWDIGTITRLGLLRKTLDGDAAKSMDTLLGRLAGQRKAWESGELVNGLMTMLSAETNTFASGRSVPVEVHIRNVSTEDRQYSQVQMHGSDFIVTNKYGRRVPLLGGYVGRVTRQTTIKPGETNLIGQLDLAGDHYLRRPGRYSVSYRGYGMPPSNSFSFSVRRTPLVTRMAIRQAVCSDGSRRNGLCWEVRIPRKKCGQGAIARKSPVGNFNLSIPSKGSRWAKPSFGSG